MRKRAFPTRQRTCLVIANICGSGKAAETELTHLDGIEELVRLHVGDGGAQRV